MDSKYFITQNQTRHYHTTHWPSSTMLHTAVQFINMARQKKIQDPFPFLVPSILLSFTAIETRLNECIHCKFLKARYSNNELLNEYVLEKLLKEKPIDEKIKKSTKVLTGKDFDVQGPIWGSFKNLQKLRNKIMHYKLEGLKELEAEQAAEVFPIKTNNGKTPSEVIKEGFYKNLFYQEVTINKAVEAYETAHEILEKLNSLYYGR